MGMFDGQVAIVTGSGRGIGRKIAEMYAQEGASVVVNDLDAVPAEEVVASIKAMGGKAVACIGNVTAPDFGERFVKTAIDSFGGLDIIVHNAGYTWDATVRNTTDEMWYAMLDVHMTAALRVFRAAAPFVIETAKKEIAANGTAKPRKVIVVSSLSGQKGNIGQMGYSAAKAGQLGMIRTLAREWARYNVNVNAVAYGSIETRLTVKKEQGENVTINIGGIELPVGIPKDVAIKSEAAIPLGRQGTIEEAAGPVIFLSTPAAGFITGQCINIDGGRFI